MVNQEDVLKDIQRALDKYDELTITKFDDDPEFVSRGPVYDYFESWKEAIRKAGGESVSNEYTDKELLEQVRKCYREHGKVTRETLEESNGEAHPKTIANRFGTLTRAKRCAGVEVTYSRLEDEVREELDEWISSSEFHKRVLQGLVMGDASVDSGGNLILEMKSLPFLTWVKETFGEVASSVTPTTSGRHQLILRNIDTVKEFRSWYESGEKRFPENLELTPVNTKVWYCCDGGLNYSDNSASARFYTSNEDDRLDWLCSLFREKGHNARKRERERRSCVYFYVDDTKKLLKWMGEPLPGYEYKWVTESKEEYSTERVKSHPL